LPADPDCLPDLLAAINAHADSERDKATAAAAAAAR
jgi:hypothetical protein